MNEAHILGRLIKDVELKTVGTKGTANTNFTIAVDRKFKDANGQKQADFLNIVAWGKTAETIAKYFGKGSRILVNGSVQSRSYKNSDDKTVYVTEIVADSIEFIDARGTSTNDSQSVTEASAPTTKTAEPFYPAMDDDTSLPFDI